MPSTRTAGKARFPAYRLDDPQNSTSVPSPKCLTKSSGDTNFRVARASWRSGSIPICPEAFKETKSSSRVLPVYSSIGTRPESWYELGLESFFVNAAGLISGTRTGDSLLGSMVIVCIVLCKCLPLIITEQNSLSERAIRNSVSFIIRGIETKSKDLVSFLLIFSIFLTNSRQKSRVSFVVCFSGCVISVGKYKNKKRFLRLYFLTEACFQRTMYTSFITFPLILST